MKRSIKWRWLAMLAPLAMLAMSSVEAAVNVRVQPSGDNVTTAYALSGEQRILFGNVEGAAAYECRWQFSDGTPATAWAAPGATRFINTTHTYASAAPHWARLTCRDPGNIADTDSETINMLVIGTDNLNRQKNDAIDDGLRYSYNRILTGGTYQGCFYGSGQYGASTGMALLAFENHGHNLDSNDEDIYKAVVEDGLACILRVYPTAINMTNQACVGDPELGDSDADNDNKGLRFQSTNQYYTPFMMMAIVNAGSLATGQSHVVNYGNAAVNGMTLYDIAIDTKDYLVWSQGDANSCVRNGWRYWEHSAGPDNSANQWPALALAEAATRWGIDANPVAKTQQDAWLTYSQYPGTTGHGGGFCYTSCGSSNYARTAAGVIDHQWVGTPIGDSRVQRALDYLERNFFTTASDGNTRNFYAMYGFYKAMKLYGIPDDNFRGIDWTQEYTNWLVNSRQFTSTTYKGSYFRGIYNWFNTDFDTYVALAILAPEVASLPPVAQAGPDQSVLPGTVVNFDGSASVHADPTKALFVYRWDFDASDGLWWEAGPFPAAGEGSVGVTASNVYPDTGATANYTVTLQVTDNGGTPANPDPAMTDSDSLNVEVGTFQVPPVPVTNGPWAAIPGVPVTFDGSASFDPNPGDTIVSYDWDLDGDGIFNEVPDDGTPVAPGVVTKTFPAPTSGVATLRVTDNHGASASSDAEFIAVGLAYVTAYENCWVTRTGRFTYHYGMIITVENIGDAEIQNLEMTLTGVPDNRTIVDGMSLLGTLAPAAQAATACDPGAKTADISTILNRRVPFGGTWEWKAEFDSDGTHYVIPNLPPLAP
ncbi:hypothetical protein DJ031_18720 [bacterium endosymbiont of Escarpia laminata]|nr:MAG: hypothetical protein DJ031_18720 [bacterium endosymbiont of Escarpia laminata]